jgi:UPF0755 protein
LTDDLGLGLSGPDADPEPPTRPSYGRRRIAVAVVALAVIAVIAAAVLLSTRIFDHIFGAAADYSGRGTGTVQVQVHPGDSITTIGQTLEDSDVVRSVDAFVEAANASDEASSIGPGFYQLRKHMKASLALALLLDPASLVQARVVVPEGLRMRDIFARIDAASDDITVAQLEKAAKDPAALGVPAWGAGHSLEGFLFPATYDLPPGTTAEQALSAMVKRFDDEAKSLDLVGGAKKLGYTPYEVLTLASIVEREGRLTTDFAKIAEVFYNRLHRGMNLGSDATLFYVLPPDHGPLSDSDLKFDSPYNTRLHTGLPPTPIASPGTAALTAALQPAKGPYLYFVTIDKSGRAAFATTLDEFNRLVAQSRANGVE